MMVLGAGKNRTSIQPKSAGKLPGQQQPERRADAHQPLAAAGGEPRRLADVDDLGGLRRGGALRRRGEWRRPARSSPVLPACVHSAGYRLVVTFLPSSNAVRARAMTGCGLA